MIEILAPTFSQLVDMQNEWVLNGDSYDYCDSQAALIHDPTPSRVCTSKVFHWCGSRLVVHIIFPY